jgi:hypothetical protein
LKGEIVGYGIHKSTATGAEFGVTIGHTARDVDWDFQSATPLPALRHSNPHPPK